MAEPRRRTSRLKTLIFALLPALLLLAVTEVVLRLAGYNGPDADLLEFTNNHRRSPGFVLHPRRFWAFRPDNPELQINSAGLRGPEFARNKSAGTLRVLCLGDSVTFGFQLSEQQSYPRALERLLNADPTRLGPGVRSVEVLNAGVVGYTSLQGLRYLEDELLDLRPDLVLASFGSNDQLCAMVAPDAELPIYYAPVQRLWLELTSLRTVKLLRQGLARPLGLHRAALYSSADCEGNPARVDPEQFAQNLQRITAAVTAAGAHVYVLPALERPWEPPRCVRTIEFYAVPDALPVLHWERVFEGMCGAKAENYFIDGTHFNATGSVLAAQELAREILAQR